MFRVQGFGSLLYDTSLFEDGMEHQCVKKSPNYSKPIRNWEILEYKSKQTTFDYVRELFK